MYALWLTLMIMTCILDHPCIDTIQVTLNTDAGQSIIVGTVAPDSSSITISPSPSSTMPARLTPLKDLRVLRHQIPAHGLTPNTSVQNKPLLIYKSAFTSTVTAGEIETHLSSVGVVSPQWRYSMYTTSHFHVSRAITSLALARLTPTCNRQHHTKFSALRMVKRDCVSGTRTIQIALKRLLRVAMWL